MILLTGGTGSLGRSLLTLLADEPVRVLTRNADTELPSGCELVVGDVRDPGALRSAATGCSTVIAATHGLNGGRNAGPEAVDAKANMALIDTAVAAGVGRFVLISSQGADAHSPLPLLRSKFAAEQHLRGSELDWLIVRPAPSLETWLHLVVGAQVPSGGPALVLGKGENPITWVSVHDVAAVVAQALREGSSRVVLDVTGPEDNTLLDLAAATGAERVKHVPRQALGAMRYLARPFAPAFARKAAMAYALDTTDQRLPRSLGSPTPMRTLADVAADWRTATAV